MIKYLLRQTLTWFVRIVVVVNLTYFIASWFLKPAANYVGRRPPIPPDQIQRMLDQYNLADTEPLWHRWWDWLTNIVLHWNWGYSPVGASVNEQIGFRIWVSAQLMLGATLLAFLVGVALGVYSASRQYHLADRVVQVFATIFLCLSIVVVALIVVFLTVKLNDWVGHRIFYVTGAGTVGLSGWPWFIDKIQHLLLPSLCLLAISWPTYAMTQRALLLDNISADYVRLARAKGLRKATAVRRHALRTSLIPVMVSLAYSIPGIFVGASLTETIFAWNGMGRYLVQTINTNDINGAVGVAAFAALMTAVGAVLSDIIVVYLDPRVRVS